MTSRWSVLVGLMAAACPWTGCTPQCHRTKKQTNYQLPVAIWADSTGDVYIGGEQFRSHGTWPDDINPGSNGSQSLNLVAEETPNKFFSSVWGSGPNDVYAAGFGFLEHSTGTDDWKSEQQSSDFTYVWGLDSTHLYACGYNGVLLSSTGDGKWSHEPIPTSARLGGIWGTDPANLYVVGDGVIFHRGADGAWNLERSGTEKWLSVWGSASDGVYTSGLDVSGVIGHSSGDGTWSVTAINGTTTIPWISGTPGKAVFATGEPCAFLQQTPIGAAWTRTGGGCDGGYLRGMVIGDYLYIIAGRFVSLMRAGVAVDSFDASYATTTSVEQSAPMAIDGTCLW